MKIKFTKFNKRLPPLDDAVLVFGGCAFFIHVWAIYNILQVLPSWALRLGAFELLGVTSYPLAFALFESLIVWAVLMLMAAALPANLFRKQILSQSLTMLALLASGSALLHFNEGFVVQNRRMMLILVPIALVIVFIISYHLGRLKRAETLTRTLLKRVVVLSGLYVFFDLIGISVIVWRNFSSWWQS